MPTKRIYQIAKELNISHTEIVRFLKLKNIEVSSYMAPVNQDIYDMILMTNRLLVIANYDESIKIW